MRVDGGSGQEPNGRPEGEVLTERAISLFREYQRSRDQARLAAAVGSFRAAVAATPLGQPYHAAYLVNLGIGLIEQSQVTGEPALLAEALRTARDALAATTCWTAPTDDEDVRKLRGQHPGIAAELDELRDRLRALDTSNGLPLPDATIPGDVSQVLARSQAHAAAAARQRGATAWDAFLTQVRALPGFGSFLKPSTIASLACQAKDGPVVFVTTSPLRCDALILRAGTTINGKQ